jgi:hypothetical protein
MNALCRNAVSFLEKVYSGKDGLFPYTTRLEQGEYRSIYDHPMAVRCTINCLLGLQEAAKFDPQHRFLGRVDEMTERFLRLHEHDLTNLGDLGLLIVHLCERPSGVITTSAFDRLKSLSIDQGRIGALNLQDTSWLLWGSIAAARSNLTGAETLAHDLFLRLTGRLLAHSAVLPRHDLNPLRRRLVSFGGTTYFLRAVYEYGRYFDHREALALFRRATTAVVSSQGPNGEWPWMLATSDARPLDVYPVFSVHQHSMSMLFLFPALDEGIPQIQGAIDKSVTWITGANQLGLPMIQWKPFLIYRSLERRAVAPRPVRYVRAWRVSEWGRPAGLAENDRLFVNTESRSYELGWLLYALSGRHRLAETVDGDRG